MHGGLLKKIERSVLLIIIFQSIETGNDQLRSLCHTFLNKLKANALICVERERCRSDTKKNSFCCVTEELRAEVMQRLNRTVNYLHSVLSLFARYSKCIHVRLSLQLTQLYNNASVINTAFTSCALQRFATSNTVCIPECYSFTLDCVSRLQRG